MDPTPLPRVSDLDASLPRKSRDEHRIPTSSFTFSISDLWKPTKEPIKQWINQLPVHVGHEEPLEPAHYRNLKHSFVSSYLDNELFHFTVASARRFQWMKADLPPRVLKTPMNILAPKTTAINERRQARQQDIGHQRNHVAAGWLTLAVASSIGFPMLVSVLPRHLGIAAYPRDRIHVCLA
ncbi:hypothetical protein RRF57_006770 [Xylaria bambusicola]|uniref:Uncharacterized protein n=1 Tax=Xylaria bambusicola TaxID=326684 RepID=A0AAN7YZ76_9PEZI